MTNQIDRAVSEASRAANEAIRDLYKQRDFKIVRFGRHRDGYLHAFVRVDDTGLVYVFECFGSWQIPSQPQPDFPDYDGPPLRDVVAPYTYALSEEARRFRAAEHKREEARLEAERDRASEQREGRDEAAQAA